MNSTLDRPLAKRIERIAQRPFVRLLQLFFDRTFRGGGQSDSGEMGASEGLLLVLLPLPGAFVSIFLLYKYGSLLQWLRNGFLDPYAASFSDEYFFIVLSMVVTGVIAVWRWDSIFLDRHDYANLVHLPISTLTIFSANLTAILFLTVFFAVEVNIASAVLFPLFVSSSYVSFSIYWGFAEGHAISVALASAFTFSAVVAVIGVLMCCFPYRVFRVLSRYVRILMILSFLILLVTSFAVAPLVRKLSLTPSAPIRFLPPVWFLALCETLRHHSDRIFEELGSFGIKALAWTILLAVGAYSLSYRRCFRSIPETVETKTSRVTFLSSFVFGVLARLCLRNSVDRACFPFAFKTLMRSERHFTILGAFLGLGLVICAQTLGAGYNGVVAPGSDVPSSEVLSIPLILVYCIAIGLTFVFEMPSDLRANWIFKLAVDTRTHETRALTRAIMLTSTLPWLYAAALPAYAYGWGLRIGLLHVLMITASTVLLVEILLVRFRKIPFTCSYPAFKQHSFLILFALIVGFYIFVGLASIVEHWVLLAPIRLASIVIFFAATWTALHYYRKTVLNVDKQVIFDEAPVETVQVLGISARI